MVCDALDHYTKDYPWLKEVLQYVKECPNQPRILTNPFPTQQQQFIVQNLAPPRAANPGNLPSGAG